MSAELSQGIAFRSPDWLDVLPEQCNVLWTEQREQVAQISAAMHEGYRRLLVQAPTGAGKTHEIATCALAASDAGLRVLILATRTRLVQQIHDRLTDFSVPHGVIAAAIPGHVNFSRLVQVASADTLYRRAIVDGKTILPAADLVIFDEAHLALGDSRQAIIERYPNAWLLGFTATPAKVSGKPLGEMFDRLLLGLTMPQLIDLKRLVPARIFNKPVISASELKQLARDSRTDDFRNTDLGVAMGKPKLVGDVVTNWLRIANDKRTLVFACNKMHGAQLLQEFLQAGVAAELLTDDDAEPAREAAIARLERGETKVIVNCFLLAYGVDLPSVEAIVLARPTRSLVLYLQAVGRGMRTAPGKESVIVIDHGRVIETLGLPTEDFGWSLHEGNVNKTARESHNKQRETGEERARECPECNHLWLVSEEGNGCRECGWQPAPKPKQVATSDAELHEHKPVAENFTATYLEVQRFYREALFWYMRKWPRRWAETPTKGRAFAWNKTKERYKLMEDKWPQFYWRLQPKEPSKKNAGWLDAKHIAYNRGRQTTYQTQRQLEQAANRILDRQFDSLMERQ